MELQVHVFRAAVTPSPTASQGDRGGPTVVRPPSAVTVRHHHHRHRHRCHICSNTASARCRHRTLSVRVLGACARNRSEVARRRQQSTTSWHTQGQTNAGGRARPLAPAVAGMAHPTVRGHTCAVTHLLDPSDEVSCSASCHTCRSDGVVRGPAGQPVREVGARYCERCRQSFRGIRRRNPAFHHFPKRAPGDAAAASQEATPNRAEQE